MRDRHEADKRASFVDIVVKERDIRSCLWERGPRERVCVAYVHAHRGMLSLLSGGLWIRKMEGKRCVDR